MVWLTYPILHLIRQFNRLGH